MQPPTTAASWPIEVWTTPGICPFESRSAAFSSKRRTRSMRRYISTRRSSLGIVWELVSATDEVPAKLPFGHLVARLLDLPAAHSRIPGDEVLAEIRVRDL